VVERIQTLAREQGVPVLLVTHDNRILDVADRIVHLEDGRLSSFSDAVAANTRQLMGLFADKNRTGELARRVAGMNVRDFQSLLETVTREADDFLRVTQLAQEEAFDSLLDQALEAFTHKIGNLLQADRASIFLLDEQRGELWSKGARDLSGDLVEIRVPRGNGIAGAVIESGESIRLDDVYADPRFNRAADDDTGYRTRSLLCIPLHDRAGRVFGVAQILNRLDGQPFDDADEAQFRAFMASIAVILETWWKMGAKRREQEQAMGGIKGRPDDSD
jgi:adenylate cyclase